MFFSCTYHGNIWELLCVFCAFAARLCEPGGFAFRQPRAHGARFSIGGGGLAGPSPLLLTGGGQNAARIEKIYIKEKEHEKTSGKLAAGGRDGR